MAKSKRPTAADTIRKLRSLLNQTIVERDVLKQGREGLLRQEGTLRERIADLETQLQDAEIKADRAQAEAALNVENLEEELVEAKKSAAYNNGLADGRREAMDLFKNIIMNIGTAIRPLAGHRPGEDPDDQVGD
jgi:seryl-tRNA synthetase